MKISVIVSTYNRPSALKRVLEALFDQTKPPDQIIVADDGSSRDTREVVQKFTQKNCICLVHVWQEDKGFRAAMIRNKAVIQAQGEYLIFLDGDCIPDPYFVADHEALSKKGYFFQGKRVLIGRKLSDRFDVSHIKSHVYCIGQAIIGNVGNWHHLLRMPFFPAMTDTSLSGTRSCNMGVFTQDVKNVNGFNHAFIGWGREDSEFVHRMYQYGLKRRSHPFMARCFHLWHPENDRTRMDENDQIFHQSLSSRNWVCEQGLDTLTNTIIVK